MEIIPVKTPKLVRALYPNYLWSVVDDTKTLYLTFDDGPTKKITQAVLRTLEDYHAKATFFCIGANIKKNPDLFNEIIEKGHTIGNHTQNHVNGWKTSTKNYHSEVEQAQDTILSQSRSADSNKPYFRPPYGKITNKQAKALMDLQYKIVMWDVLSFDWKSTVTKEECYNKVIKNATNGSIIVFHDSEKAAHNMSYALPKVLEYFSNKGFQFKPLEPK